MTLIRSGLDKIVLIFNIVFSDINSRVMLIAILASFVLLQPRFRVLLFPVLRQQQIYSYFNKIKTDNKIDAVEIWQLRDLTSVGYLKYDEKILRPYSILQFILRPAEEAVFSFNSAQSRGIEKIVPSSKELPVLAINEEPFFSDQNSVITKNTDNGKFNVYLRRSLNEMRAINQTIDYTYAHKFIDSNNNWEFYGSF